MTSTMPVEAVPSASAPGAQPLLISTAQLAARTEIPESTWAHWRCEGKGPAYVKIGGHVRYRIGTVDKWLAERERSNTAQKVA